jgi:secondary thiamine-phosphate synthase enzyme
MKSHTEYLWMNTAKRREFVNITDTCHEILRNSGISEGMMLVSAMHITAAVWVNDNESGILQDAMDLLEKLAPYGPDYRHHRTGEDNGDAHLKNLLTHHQVIIPITDGKLDLGPWQTIFYAEFDGQRRKRVVVKVMGE